MVNNQKSNIFTQSFVYDFAVNGGAIGQLRTGLFIPENSIVLAARSILTVPASLILSGAATLTALSSATNVAEISFGVFGGPVDAWRVATVITSFNTGVLPFITIPALSPVALEVTIDISVEALTGGKFIGFFQYITFNTN